MYSSTSNRASIPPSARSAAPSPTTPTTRSACRPLSVAATASSLPTLPKKRIAGRQPKPSPFPPKISDAPSCPPPGSIQKILEEPQSLSPRNVRSPKINPPRDSSDRFIRLQIPSIDTSCQPRQDVNHDFKR